MQDKNDRKIYIRKCSKPETKSREIYDFMCDLLSSKGAELVDVISKFTIYNFWQC